MLTRARKRLGIPALIFGGLLLAYLLFAWFGFEPLVQRTLPRLVAERSGHHLSLAQVRFDPWRLAIEVQGLTLTEPDHQVLLKLEGLRVDFNAASLFRRAYAFDEIRLTAPQLQATLRADGRLNWQALLDAFSGPPDPNAAHDPTAAPPRLIVQRAVMEKGRIDFADSRVKGGFKTHFGPLEAELEHLSTLPEDRGEHSLSAHTEVGATVRWKGTMGLNPLFAAGEIDVEGASVERLWRHVKDALAIAPPQGTLGLKLKYQAGYVDKVFDVRVDGLDVNLDKLALQGARDASSLVALDALRLRGGHVDLVKREGGFAAVELAGGRVALTLDAQGRPSLLDWLPPTLLAAPMADPTGAPTAALGTAAPWRFRLDKLGVERLALRLVDRGFSMPLAVDVGQIKLGLQARATVGAGVPDVSVKDLGLELSDIQMRSLGAAPPLFELASLGLSQGQLDLATQTLDLGRVAASGGRMTATRDAQGRIAMLDALARKPAGKPSAPGKPWHYQVGTLEVSDFELGLREESVKPAASLDLARLRLEARDLSDDVKASVPVSLSFNVRQGGRFEASGHVKPATQTADIRFKLSELSLLPAQPYVAQKSSLLLASGQASTQGRLLLQKGKPRVEAGFAIKNLLLNEAQTRERFLGWTLLSGRQLVATPQRVDLDELSLDGLGAKLIIFKDRSTNVAKLLKPDEAPAVTKSTQSAATADAAPLQFSLGRARIRNSNMEFADLSLALPFGARIHELNGFLAGVSSRPEALTQVELNGKVDEFGLARAVGQIKLLDPPDFTDIRVLFRNVEMTSLTPYSATFAGRKIESGKLSLDLEYKVKQRQLLGDNKVVMDQLTLGDRVDSPGAMSLPLDLALAILRDADGKIDLGLPVSGSLDDPQFSYGQLVWKALVNVLGKIATAPFRALGALLGIEADKLDKIVFDAGSAELLPPEREKLLNLSRLLAQRAGLVLAVHGDYSPQLDGEAIKNLRLRRAVALQSGRSLAEGEDPGPIALAQPVTRAALEKLYAGRLGGLALQMLKQRHAQANPEAPPASATGRLVAGLSSAFKASPKPLSAQESAQLRGADLHGLLAQTLLAADPVDEGALRQVGAARAAAIQRELASRGVAAERVRLAEPRTQGGDGDSVSVEIGLGTPARP